MESSKFISNVIDSLEEYPYHLNEYDKQLDIQTLKYLVDEFDIESYLRGFNIDKQTFDTYFKDIVKKYDKPLYKKLKKDFKNYKKSLIEVENVFQLDNGYVDRDYIFESIIDSDGYYENEYQKMKMVNYLQYFFDKYQFEKHLYVGEINQTEYEVYFKDTIKEYKPQLHKQIIKNFKEKE